MKPTTEQKLERNKAATKRWTTRLTRATNSLQKLWRERTRLEAKLDAEMRDEIRAAVPHPAAINPSPPTPPKPDAGTRDKVLDDDLGIPGFLRRDKTPDPGIEQVKAEVAEKKAARTKSRIERMKLKQSGALRKMPLSGKAALAAIRGD